MGIMILECGHEPSPHGEHTTGYGTDDAGKRRCYDCCTAQDVERLKQCGPGDRFTGYISGDFRNWINWPGGKLGRVIYTGKLHPWSRERRYLSVIDVHGNLWHGTGAEDMWSTLRRAVA